ncbi:MAG: carboxylesterase family protein [Terriglobia bacterium]
MRNSIRRASAIIILLAAQAALAQVPGVVKTGAGLVAGSGNEIHVWKGVPYAQPPTGDLRWKPPQPPIAWQGIRHALEFGPMCPQGNPAQLKPDMSEDCLNLNIWSGAKAGDKMPVFVWIHGGGFVGGSNRINGEPLAHLGIVVVSINYRLGVLGYLAHPDLTRESPHHASGNYGLMDQIAALGWVHDNIAAFGGDPERVTIGGASAGGTSIGYLLASPLAKGLFQGAMLDSASRLFLPDPGLSATLHGLTPMEQVGHQIAPHISELRALSTADVIMRAARVTDEMYAEGGRGRIGLKPESCVHMPSARDHPWWAFTDGYVMPDELYRMFAFGRFNHAACLIGTCKDEGLGFTREMPDLTVEGYQNYLRKYYPAISMRMFEMYPGTTPEEIRTALTRTITDFMFLYGSLRLADYESAAGEPVYVEHFVRVPPGALGALHVADGAYFLGEVRAGRGNYDGHDERLSADMMKCLAAFVKTLDPNLPEPSPEWPTWTPKHPQYLEIGNEMQARSFRDQAILNLFRKQLGQ